MVKGKKVTFKKDYTDDITTLTFKKGTKATIFDIDGPWITVITKDPEDSGTTLAITHKSENVF